MRGVTAITYDKRRRNTFLFIRVEMLDTGLEFFRISLTPRPEPRARPSAYVVPPIYVLRMTGNAVRESAVSPQSRKFR
jgi:hypothetical protein